MIAPLLFFLAQAVPQAQAASDDLRAAERKTAIDKLARFTGLEPRYLDESNLRWDVDHYARQLLRDTHETIGRYDGRLAGPSSMDTRETSEYDPLSTLIAQPWNYDVQNGFEDTTAMLRGAMVKNPYMGLRPQMHKNITWDFYQSGHILYIHSDSHARLKHDVSEFIQSCLPAEIR